MSFTMDLSQIPLRTVRPYSPRVMTLLQPPRQSARWLPRSRPLSVSSSKFTRATFPPSVDVGQSRSLTSTVMFFRT